MGQACAASTVFGVPYDAFGEPLVEGAWVECTASTADQYFSSLGKVKFMLDGDVILSFGGMGLSGGVYNYSQGDIQSYGLRRVMADAKGEKLSVGTVVRVTINGSETIGVVTAVGPKDVMCRFGHVQTWDSMGLDQVFTQDDIDQAGLESRRREGHADQRELRPLCERPRALKAGRGRYADAILLRAMAASHDESCDMAGVTPRRSICGAAGAAADPGLA
eukprot:CAMPEP_0176093588 /NCGR_PEP_ID=MMETSP0120_2-20121206/46897_1 /TAXON_ID=160619 /ORGANISM="Kryptoperidinium foliaceum, Strain CCMP 1326" /LENGTH=219 /DNA_ID=CAMNT_0017427527 /DNA_START=66 /DNA_END=727 /DNA_ORIENTATION=+